MANIADKDAVFERLKSYKLEYLNSDYESKNVWVRILPLAVVDIKANSHYKYMDSIPNECIENGIETILKKVA